MQRQDQAANAAALSASGYGAESQSAGAKEYLSFRLGAEEYGIDIMKVQEIRCYEKVTIIANSPPHIKGVMNLRGLIVPIIDMRLLLNVGEAKYDPFTIVIILNIGSRTIGMVVDSVSDVTSLNSDDIKPAPELTSSVESNHVKGIGTLEGRMVILLDIDRIVSSEQMGLIEAVTN